jgi:hypothetical protein
MAIRERKNQGPQGLAMVRVGTKGIRVEFEGGDVFDLPLNATDRDVKTGKYNASLSADKTKLYLKPVAGQYILSFKQVGNRVNGIPTNKVQAERVGHRKDGGTFPIPAQLVWTVVLQVESEGLYKGLTTTTNLPYSFSAPTNGSNTDFYDEKRNLSQLENFLRVVAGANMATLEIPYSPNPSELLTWVENYIIQHGKPFMGNINDAGFFDIKSMSSIPDDLLPKNLKKPAKKSTKKGK